MTQDIKTILVPHDFSAGSGHALEYAQMMARRFGASLHFVHVCELPSLMTVSMDASAIASSDWSQRLGDDAKRELIDIASGIDGIKTSTEKAVEWHRPRAAAMASAVMSAMFAAVLLSPLGVTRAEAQTATVPAVVEMMQRVTGRATFQTYCVMCHGNEGRGDGRLAAHMTRKPSDLTEIAKRNGGEFPSELVFRTVDGRQPVRGHGGPDMPAWGDTFLKSREGGDANSVRETIDSLVRYVESIQAKQVP
ncbi:MAG: universal stress protein [Acidobacteriota bacterium]|nr:universal stress protein [Acidobacteriota bacterium]